MRLFVLVIFILSSVTEAVACGLRASSSTDDLRSVVEQVEAPATKALPKMIVYGSNSLIITNEKGEKIIVDENLEVTPGMTISSKAGKAKLILPSTGQVIELLPMTTLKVLELNKSSDEKICSVSFQMQTGRAVFSSNHLEREKECKPSQEGVFEVVTNHVGIAPIGTKYNVDLSQEIAELNGETYSNEDISVEKGSVKVRIIKLKKNRKKSSAKEENLAASDYVFDDQKPVTIKAGKKARVRKGKKDRLADIQVVYPEQ